MKRIVIGILIGLLLASNSQAQGNEVAAHIADRMKDTLSLANWQRDSIYQANLRLQAAKLAVRQLHFQADSIRKYTQRVENMRDSIYQPILREAQYQQYRQKKKHLISGQ